MRRFLQNIKNWWARLQRPYKGVVKVGGVLLLVFTVWQTWDFFSGKVEGWKQDARESKRIRILVPLYATKKEFLQFRDMGEKQHLKLDKSFFSKKVSRDKINAIDAASQTWFSMRRGTNDALSNKQVDFYFFPEGYVEDTKSYKEALAKALREAHADNYQVAGVIGNITSTATVEYGKLCGQQVWDISKDGAESNRQGEEGNRQDDPGQLPMILALSTAANVPQMLRASNVPAVLRLPPDNEVQSKLLADFLLRKLKKPILRTIIIRDLSNRTYSSDLTDNFRDLYVQSPLKDAQEVAAKIPKENQDKLGQLMLWGNILAVVPAGGDEGAPPVFPILEKFAPEALLVFGMTNVSLETLAQVSVSKAKPKYVILTDGAVDEYLLPQIDMLLSQKSNVQVFLSFPLETPNPESVESTVKILTDEKDKQNLEMTHAMYVIDSVYITLTLLEEGIYKNKFNDDARIILAKKMRELYENGPRDIGIKVPSNVTYTFDSFGTSMNLRYHMFRMCLPQMPDCPKDKGKMWVHADAAIENPPRK